MRIGLFGGTYDPVHLGHLRAATEVAEAFSLDRVVLVPAAVPPHKPARQVAPAADRLRMLRLAVAADPLLEVSEVELVRGGRSYTVDTVIHFRDSSAPGTALFLVMGLDAALELDSWKSVRQLLAAVPLIVVSRPGTGPAADPEAGWRRLSDYLREALPVAYRFSEAEGAFVAEHLSPIYTQEVSAMDISSTKIRQLVRAGRSIRYLVPAAVADHIAARGLYA